VLSGLAVSATITALLAGITGAWSPCGFSMVDTIGSALGDTRRSITLLACLTFTFGAVIGGILTFGGLALAGGLIGDQGGWLREALGGVIALAAAIADWRGVKIAPQIRRQVPERWRWTMPLSVACGLYGVLLGLGFTTFVLTFAVWALAGIAFTAASLPLGLLVGVAFGVGRALPIVWMAPGLHNGNGANALDGMASEPRLWLGLRRLDALALTLCAVFLSGASASAATLARATDPSAAGENVVWQQINGPGVLRSSSGMVSTLPGTYPALGGSLIAWQNGGQVTIAERVSMAPKLTLAVANLDALAISDTWVVYRDHTEGKENLIGVLLLDPTKRRYVAGSRFRGEIGRPSLDGSSVVFAVDTTRRSTIEMVDLATGMHRTLRSSGSGAALMNPSILGGQLAYERIDRCAQELRIGPADTSKHDRVLLSRPSTVQRDHGYEPNYEHAYNTASICRNRASGPGTATQLGPTSLTASKVYTTEMQSKSGDAQIISIAYGS
jgi:hypothetical protein